MGASGRAQDVEAFDQSTSWAFTIGVPTSTKGDTAPPGDGVIVNAQYQRDGSWQQVTWPFTNISQIAPITRVPAGEYWAIGYQDVTNWTPNGNGSFTGAGYTVNVLLYFVDGAWHEIPKVDNMSGANHKARSHFGCGPEAAGLWLAVSCSGHEAVFQLLGTLRCRTRGRACGACGHNCLRRLHRTARHRVASGNTLSPTRDGGFGRACARAARKARFQPPALRRGASILSLVFLKLHNGQGVSEEPCASCRPLVEPAIQRVRAMLCLLRAFDLVALAMRGRRLCPRARRHRPAPAHDRTRGRVALPAAYRCRRATRRYHSALSSTCANSTARTAPITPRLRAPLLSRSARRRTISIIQSSKLAGHSRCCSSVVVVAPGGSLAASPDEAPGERMEHGHWARLVWLACVGDIAPGGWARASALCASGRAIVGSEWISCSPERRGRKIKRRGFGGMRQRRLNGWMTRPRTPCGPGAGICPFSPIQTRRRNANHKTIRGTIPHSPLTGPYNAPDLSHVCVRTFTVPATPPHRPSCLCRHTFH